MANDYTTVTELPGSGATKEQLSALQTRYKIARELSKGKDVLEVACGPGIGLGYLAKSARRVTGGDFDPKLVQLAQQYYGSRVDVLRLDAQALPFPDESFDVVLFLEAIYYLPEPQRFFRETARVLRPGGVVFVCSANPEWADFNPSPYSHGYYSASRPKEMIDQAGFQTRLSAGFPVKQRGLKHKILAGARRVAVKLHLIPRTMGGKAVLKRLLFGKLTGLPAELGEESGAISLTVAIDGDGPVRMYKVVYAVGQK